MNNKTPEELFAQRCLIDRKMLSEVHLAVCGDTSLGIPGLVGDMKNVKQRLVPLEQARQGGIIIGRTASLIIGGLVAMSTVGCFIIAALTLIKSHP